MSRSRGVTPDQLAAVAEHPRWRTQSLSTDRTVVGGYLAAAGCAALGLVVGLGLDLLVVRLAT